VDEFFRFLASYLTGLNFWITCLACVSSNAFAIFQLDFSDHPGRTSALYDARSVASIFAYVLLDERIHYANHIF
jgi:hypothetical protein